MGAGAGGGGGVEQPVMPKSNDVAPSERIKLNAFRALPVFIDVSFTMFSFVFDVWYGASTCVRRKFLVLAICNNEPRFGFGQSGVIRSKVQRQDGRRGLAFRSGEEAVESVECNGETQAEKKLERAKGFLSRFTWRTLDIQPVERVKPWQVSERFTFF